MISWGYVTDEYWDGNIQLITRVSSESQNFAVVLPPYIISIDPYLLFIASDIYIYVPRDTVL